MVTVVWGSRAQRIRTRGDLLDGAVDEPAVRRAPEEAVGLDQVPERLKASREQELRSVAYLVVGPHPCGHPRRCKLYQERRSDVNGSTAEPGDVVMPMKRLVPGLLIPRTAFQGASPTPASPTFCQGDANVPPRQCASCLLHAHGGVRGKTRWRGRSPSTLASRPSRSAGSSSARRPATSARGTGSSTSSVAWCGR